jgi:glycine/D-amino acid oxidase-like deaminating enzyme
MEWDCIFIGGGFSGLASALRVKAACPMWNIAVLESNRIGYGASSRNSGIIHSPHYYGSSEVATKFTNAQSDFRRYFPGAGFETRGLVYGTREDIENERTKLIRLKAPWRELSDSETRHARSISAFLSDKEFIAVPQFIVDPIRVLGILSSCCLYAGVKLFTECRATRIIIGNRSAVGLKCSGNRLFTAKNMIITAGEGAYGLLRGLNSKLADAIRVRTQTMVAISGLGLLVGPDGMRLALQPSDAKGVGIVPARDDMALIGLDYRPPKLNLRANAHLCAPNVDEEIVSETISKVSEIFPSWDRHASRISTWAGVKTDFIGLNSDYEESLTEDNPNPLIVNHFALEGISNLHTMFCGKMTLFIDASRRMAEALGCRPVDPFIENDLIAESPVTTYNNKDSTKL